MAGVAADPAGDSMVAGSYRRRPRRLASGGRAGPARLPATARARHRPLMQPVRNRRDPRVTAAYSAKTYGELRDLAGDLPRPAAPAGLRSETVASRRAPQGASRRLVSVMIWVLFALVLAAGLAG